MSRTIEPLVFVVGTTGVGKSAWALKHAALHNGAIVNGDSLQFYKGLDIGTAKPSLAEQAKVPHFLFDICQSPEKLTAADFRRAALSLIEDQGQKHRLFFVGGSGFYLGALEKGMFNIGKIPDEVEARVESLFQDKGLPGLFEELKKLDEDYSEIVSPTDSYRVRRALTVMWSFGKPWTVLRKEFEAKQEPFPYQILKIGLRVSREELRTRVEARTDQMIQAGLKEEVEKLLNQGLSEWEPLQSVGYKETLAHLRGELNAQEWREMIVLRTMQLAKRQLTWFNRDPEIHWFAPGSLDSSDFLKSQLQP